MSVKLPRVGQIVRASRNIPLTGHRHVRRLTHGFSMLRKGTEAEITAIGSEHVELNCKDGFGNDIYAWGLRIRVAKAVFGFSFD